VLLIHTLYPDLNRRGFMKRGNFHLAYSQIESLRTLSRVKGLGVSELVRRAVDEYLERVLVDENDDVKCVPGEREGAGEGVPQVRSS